MKAKVTIGLPIDVELNNVLNKLAPRGTKAMAIRKMLELLIDAQRQLLADGKDEFIVDKLIRGQCKLVVISNSGSERKV